MSGQIPAIYTNANKAAPWRARHVFAVTWVSFRRKLTGINCRDAIYTRFPGLRYRSGPPSGGLATPPFQSGVGSLSSTLSTSKTTAIPNSIRNLHHKRNPVIPNSIRNLHHKRNNRHSELDSESVNIYALFCPHQTPLAFLTRVYRRK